MFEMLPIVLSYVLWSNAVVRGTSSENDLSHYFSQYRTALSLMDSSNLTVFGCVWKSIYDGPPSCPDPDVRFYHYSGGTEREMVEINPEEDNTLQKTQWDPHKHNIVYIHGYGSAHDVFPTTIIRDAYLSNGSYNVFIVDWSPLAKMPCYLSAIYNLNKVSKCTAQLYRNIRSQGIPSNRVTCVGHSLGAHGCGLISKHIDFRMYQIIGLDPAGPMIPNYTRLKPGMANNVQAIYTNAGTFGDTFSTGGVNFCMNGGKVQPVCKNMDIGQDLCSHLQSVCYLAESISGASNRMALPCARQCPFGPRRSQVASQPVPIGQHTPDKVTGSYCLSTKDTPYCPRPGSQIGHPWCCLTDLSIDGLA